jgi:hypothetical protein
VPALGTKLDNVASLCARATAGKASSASAAKRALNHGLFFMMIPFFGNACCIGSSVVPAVSGAFS